MAWFRAKTSICYRAVMTTDGSLRLRLAGSTPSSAGRRQTSGGPPVNMWGAKKNDRVIAWAKDYTNLPQNALIVTDKKIQQSPDQAKRVIKGTIEALRFIQTNKKESIEILAAYSRSDRETAVSMFESYFPAYSRDGAMTNEA